MYRSKEQIGTMVESIYTPRLQGSVCVDDAIEMMDEYEVNVIGVECESDFVGLFSRDDFEKNVIRWNLHPSETTLYETITLNPPYVTPELSIYETYSAMLAYQVNHIPVISGRTLLGIARISDLRRYINESRQNFTDDQGMAAKNLPHPERVFLPEHVAANKVII